MRKYLVSAAALIFLSDVVGGVAYLQKWQISSLWVFASRLVVPFAFGVLAARRQVSVGQAGRLGGLLAAAITAWLPVAIVVVAILYRFKKEPTPWLSTLMLAMAAWVVVAGILGWIGASFGAALARPRGSNVSATT